MLANKQSYKLTTSEKNNLLRYIALVYSEQKRATDACKILAKLCKKSPSVPALHREYAFALANDSRFDKAEAALNKAIELQADNVNAHAQLGHVYCRTGRIEAGCNSYSRAATLEPKNAKYLQRLLYWSNYSEYSTPHSNRQLSQLWAHRAFPTKLAQSYDQNLLTKDKVLHIGFVLSDRAKNIGSYFVAPMVNSLSRSEFRVIVYNDTKKKSRRNEALRESSDRWRNSAKLKDGQLIQQIVDDKIDILINLTGHAKGNRLSVFAAHAAPMQVSWLGYPSTIGLESIAYRISDRIADPMGDNDQFYKEKLLRLPNGLICYAPPQTAPNIEERSVGSHIRFGSFNSLAKVSSLTLDCWAAALLAVPESTLTVKHHSLKSDNSAAYFLKQLRKRGIDSERIEIKDARTNIEQHLSLYQNIDIALDTSPYNGLIATLEALWMGVPVVSLCSQSYASRVCTSVLHRLDLQDLSTTTVTDFAERARSLANDQNGLNELRGNLRTRMKESRLMNYGQFAREFSLIIKTQWNELCETYNDAEHLSEGPVSEEHAVE